MDVLRRFLIAAVAAGLMGCSPQAKAALPDHLAITVARIFDGNVQVQANDDKGLGWLLIYDASMRLKWSGRADAAIPSFDGRLVSYVANGVVTTLEIETLTPVVPNLPLIPSALLKGDFTVQNYQNGPASFIARIDRKDQAVLVWCRQGASSCITSTPMPCPFSADAQGSIYPVSMGAGQPIVLATYCVRFEGESQHSKLLAYVPGQNKWQVLWSDIQTLNDWPVLFTSMLREKGASQLEFAAPAADGRSLTIFNYDLGKGTTASRTNEVPDAARPYAALSSRVLMSLMDNPAMLARTPGRRWLDADGSGMALFVDISGATSKLCFEGQNGAVAVMCSEQTFQLGRLDSVRSFKIEGRDVSYLVARPEQPNGDAVLYLHGGPMGAVTGLDAIGSAFLDRGYDVVVPIYTGGASRFGQLLYPDAATFDSLKAADEAAAVQKDATQSLGLKGKWLNVSQSFGGFIAQIMAGREVPANAYVVFAGYCNPEIMLQNELDPHFAIHRNDPIQVRMVKNGQSGCGGFKNVSVPVIGFVYKNDAILTPKGAAHFSSAVRAARLGRVFEYDGTEHGIKDAADAVRDVNAAIEIIHGRK